MRGDTWEVRGKHNRDRLGFDFRKNPLDVYEIENILHSKAHWFAKDS